MQVNSYKNSAIKIPYMKKLIFLLAVFIYIPMFAQENSILWKVEKDGVVSYLLGTNHIFGKAFVTDNKKIMGALKSCEVVMLENIQPKDPIINSRKPFGYINDLSAEEKATLEKIIDIKMDAAKYTIKELLLVTQNYWDRQSCVHSKEQDNLRMDDFIHEYAITSGKELSGLEDIAETMAFIETEYLKDVDPAKMAASLKYRLNGIIKNKPQNCDMNDLYAKGKYKFDFKSEVVYNIIYLRNKNWMEKITAVMADKKSAFIAVGAAHLDYTTGLIALLTAQGYTVSPVKL